MDAKHTAPRILCLHGYHGTGAILRRQMAGLVSALPEPMELVFPDAPALRRGDFGWWHPGFAGWESSRDAVLSQLRSEPFDGVFGFSQGAAMAGLIAAVQHAEEPSRLFGSRIPWFSSTRVGTSFPRAARSQTGSRASSTPITTLRTRSYDH